jgi:hypothetical protein
VSFLAIEVVKGVVWQGGAARQWGVAVAAGGGWGHRRAGTRSRARGGKGGRREEVAAGGAHSPYHATDCTIWRRKKKMTCHALPLLSSTSSLSSLINQSHPPRSLST